MNATERIEKVISREHAITAAKLNGETVREQRDRYDAELRQTHREYQEQLASLRGEITNLKTAIREITLRRDTVATELRALYEVLENAVIPDPTRLGEKATLFYLYEAHEYSPRCRNCRDLNCIVEDGETTGCDAVVPT